MINPRITYLENLKNAKVNRTRFNKAFKDIYILGKLNKGGLGQTNEEEAVFKVEKFIPGKIYTYRYDPLYKDALDYYDTRPVIMVRGVFYAEGTKNWILQGINFNFLPPEAKTLTLEKFWENFKSEIEKSEQYANRNLVNTAISKILYFFTQWKTVLKVFGGGSGIDYSFAYRNYIIDRIEDVRYIEYGHWEMIPFLEPKEILGETLDNIYRKYIETR